MTKTAAIVVFIVALLVNLITIYGWGKSDGGSASTTTPAVTTTAAEDTSSADTTASEDTSADETTTPAAE